MKQYKKSVQLWKVNASPYTDTPVQHAERDDQNILYRAYEETYIDNQDLNDTIEASGVNFDVYKKYKTQLCVDVSTDNDDDEILMYFKPVWPTVMTLEMLRNKDPKKDKIYAKFDDETILCFEYEKGMMGIVANWLSPQNAKKFQPPDGAASGRKVTFDSSLDAPPLPDSDDVDL